MSKYRRAAKRDQSEPVIVEALQAAGWTCFRDLPVDLLLVKRVGNQTVVRLMEVKTPTGTGKRRKRNDQVQQEVFCDRFEVPVVLTPDQALSALEST